MSWLTELGRRLRTLFRGRTFDHDLQEEMRLHLELRRQEYIAQGLSPSQAHAAAQRQFGNATLLVTFALVTMVLGMAALLAICASARKATRIEPTVALRHD